MKKSDCKHVSPAILHAERGRRLVKDERAADFDFLGGRVGVPWINEGDDA